MTGKNTETPNEQTKKEESDISTERVKFLWDLLRPNSPYRKTAWVDLKKEKPYLFDEEKAATETAKEVKLEIWDGANWGRRERSTN